MLQEQASNPASLDPLKTSAISGINRTYDGVSKRMEADLAGRGFGSGGKVVANKRAIETSRAGSIAGTESQFAGMEIDQKNRLLQLMQQFGFSSPGQTTSGSQTLPGNVLGGAVGNATETATLLYALSKMGGGGTGGGN